MRKQKEIQERLNYLRYSLSGSAAKDECRGAIKALEWVMMNDTKENKIQALQKEIDRLKGVK